MKARATTLGAVMMLSACASDSKTVDITAPAAAGSSTLATTAPTTAASTVPATGPTTTAMTNASTASLGGESVLALRTCVNALVDDPSAPGVNFVEEVQKLSVGYPMVEPLAAAQSLCSEASTQLEAEGGEAGSSSATLLAGTLEVNTALDLAAEQIRTDGFYFGGSLPAQFIPDGATALRRSIEVFYSQASVALG